MARQGLRHSATTEVQPSKALSEYIAQGALDAELAALLWAMSGSATPLVVAAEVHIDAQEFRQALADVALPGGTLGVGSLADAVFPGRAMGNANSLEDVISATAGNGESHLPDAARELGVVVILGPRPGGVGVRVLSAHYIRPIERDAAGHIQRRPPALLAAWNEDAQRLDHFDWGIVDELATRALMSTDYFERLRSRRRRLLDDLCAARVFDRVELRARIEHAALAELGAEETSRPDTPN